MLLIRVLHLQAEVFLDIYKIFTALYFFCRIQTEIIFCFSFVLCRLFLFQKKSPPYSV